MPKNQHIKEMNWGFLLFRGSYTYKKGLIVQSSSKTTQLLDPPFLEDRNGSYTLQYPFSSIP